MIRSLAPIIAAVGAERQGQLGSFTHGMAASAEQRRRAAALDAEQQYQQEQLDRAARAEQRQREAFDYRIEQDRAEAAAQKERQLRTTIAGALQPLASNPLYADGVSPQEAAGLTLQIPGVGNVSLADAFQKIGVVRDASGTYYPFSPLPAPDVDLVPVPGPDGKPVYGPKVKGARVYERPRVPPRAPRRRTQIVRQPGASPLDPDRLVLIDSDTGEIIRTIDGTGSSTPPPPPPGASNRTSTPKIGDVKTFPNGARGRWDGRGWVQVSAASARAVPPAHARTPYRIGDVVTVKGKRIRITQLNPDGSYSGEPVR